ncbi:MAG: tetratricopeptide repeat protein [Bacteroidales bacterium]|nr:tetratricopeptide repeat protein [Bacteroidales bacterium]
MLRKYTYSFLLFSILSFTHHFVVFGQDTAETEGRLQLAGTPQDSLSHLIQLTSEHRFTEPARGIVCGKAAVSIARRMNDSHSLALAYTALGHVYYEKSNYGLALEAYTNALNRCLENYDRQFVGNCLNNIGKVYRESGIYPLAIIKFEQAIDLFTEENDEHGLAESYLYAGITYFKMKEYDQAMQFFNNVLDVHVDDLNSPIRATTYKNIGNIFLQRGEYPMAGDFYQRAYNIFQRTENLKGMASIHARMGLSDRLQGNYFAALDKYSLAENIFSAGNNRKRLAKTYLAKAEVYHYLNYRTEAIEYVNRAIALAHEHGLPEVLKDSYYLLYKLYADGGNMNSALEYYKNYVSYQDSLFNEELAYIIALTETRNTLLQHDINPELIPRGNQFQTYTKWFALVLFIFAVLIVILAFSRLIHQRKANKILAHQRNILKQTLSELRINEEKYKALFSQANDAIFLMDRDIYTDCNDKTLEIFECNREDIIGHPPYKFSPKTQPDGKNSKEKAFELIKQCYRDRPQRFYWVHTKKDGTPFHTEVSLNIITLENGKYIQAIVRDISDRVRAEKDMIAAREKAEKATTSKTFFLAKMSHEIRTMLGGITSSAQLLKETRLNKHQAEMLDIISTSADNLLEIVNEILDMSKVEAGKVDLEERPFDLKHTLKSVVNAYLPKAREKKITLYLSLHPHVPDHVSGDELRFRQILNNLLSNAIKFTDTGNVTLEAKVITEYENSYLISFNITDTGIGIPENKVKDLFSEYSQSDASISRRYGGTGLGLNIVYKLVTLFKGTIEVSSELNKGTQFLINLPFNKTEALPAKGKKEPRPLKKYKKLHILLAEDNVINQKIILINLNNLGHHVDLAIDGNDAWQKYLEENYDLILMDIQMPGMDGIEVTHMIRDHEQQHPEKKRTRIVALTANILGKDAEYCLTEGMDAYISKPFRIEDIIDKIESAGV